MTRHQGSKNGFFAAAFRLMYSTVFGMKFRITAVVAAALISSHGSAAAICMRSEPYCDA
jgi:hypothetical protein